MRGSQKAPDVGADAGGHLYVLHLPRLDSAVQARTPSPKPPSEGELIGREWDGQPQPQLAAAGSALAAPSAPLSTAASAHPRALAPPPQRAARRVRGASPACLACEERVEVVERFERRLPESLWQLERREPGGEGERRPERVRHGGIALVEQQQQGREEAADP